ncbi:MAG: TerB family tellurite resistance protein [Betaproteobacteria bacterium AqS2]|uniref:TerB family tellurite resistance protein n=1 Tax=Candidatus Amphirhobacter heronislandensis TaxID=1732024 RepID=A0A930UCZ5_9GAMM|nr:TerB family tellurite resistance protein [Betaproteobacteria bacterium AqS2]
MTDKKDNNHWLKSLVIFAVGAGAGAGAAAFYLSAKNKKQLREVLDLEDPQDTTALRALYVIAHEMVHADGVEEVRELRMLVDLVRKFLNRPGMGKEQILREYRQYRGVKMADEEFLALSQAYRSRLFICALHIAFSDEKFPDEEMQVLRDIAERLGLLEKETTEKLEHIANIEDVREMISRLPQLDIRQWACEVLQVPLNVTPGECGEARRRVIRVVLNIDINATEEQCQEAYIRLEAEAREEVNDRIDEIDEAFSLLTSAGAGA